MLKIGHIALFILRVNFKEFFMEHQGKREGANKDTPADHQRMDTPRHSLTCVYHCQLTTGCALALMLLL